GERHRDGLALPGPRGRSRADRLPQHARGARGIRAARRDRAWPARARGAHLADRARVALHTHVRRGAGGLRRDVRRRPRGREHGALMDYRCLIYEFDDAVATLTLNRPDRLNALGDTLREDLLHALERAAGDAKVRAIILTGAGKGFCAGGDVKAMN